MKKIIVSLLLLLTVAGKAQFYLSSGAQVTLTGNTQLWLNNIDFLNNGSFDAGNSTVHFSGNLNSVIGGNNPTTFYGIYLAKSGQKLLLNQNINVINQVQFQSGFIDLNNKVLDLGNTGSLLNEYEATRIIGPNGGYITASHNIVKNGNYVNIGNLGAIVSSTVTDLGMVTIRRGHAQQQGTGLSASISRYYDITPTNNTNLSARLEFRYYDGELNGFSEGDLQFYKSTDNGLTWALQPGAGPHEQTVNYVVLNPVSDFSRWTLAGPVNSPLPVLGLDFTARRINDQQVLLDWRTVQEISNKGFYVERRDESQQQFTIVGFVPSAAAGGNSTSELTYRKIDDNDASGKTFYRLKQEDLNGKITYSSIRIVNGKAQNSVGLRAYPNPSTGPVTVIANGISGNEKLIVADAAGRMIWQGIISNNNSLQLPKLIAGTYIVYLDRFKNVLQRIVVQ